MIHKDKEIGILCLCRRGLDSLHEAKTTGLDFGDSILLVLRDLLVSGLELRELVLEQLFSVLDLLLLGVDLCLELVSREGLKLLDLRLLLVIAQVDVGWRAHGLKVFVSELLERVEVASTLVVLERGGVAVLDGGESANAIVVAEWLAGRSAVYVGDEGGGATLKLGHEFVPSWFHGLAVSSPRRKKLDEYSLSSGSFVPSVGSQLRGGRDRERGGDDSGRAEHVVCFVVLCLN